MGDMSTVGRTGMPLPHLDCLPSSDLPCGVGDARMTSNSEGRGMQHEERIRKAQSDRSIASHRQVSECECKCILSHQLACMRAWNGQQVASRDARTHDLQVANPTLS